jgi:HAMP domain-containing protein
MAPIDLAHISAVLERFTRADLGRSLSSIESALIGLTAGSYAETIAAAGVTSEVLSAAASLKRLAGQVNVAIHAAGILLCLPHILQAEERVEYVSLGAGNTGREFDLETTRRIAEFKFIHWRGGPESIRQNGLFKDFYLLAESTSKKSKDVSPWVPELVAESAEIEEEGDAA